MRFGAWLVAVLGAPFSPSCALDPVWVRAPLCCCSWSLGLSGGSLWLPRSPEADVASRELFLALPPPRSPLRRVVLRFSCLVRSPCCVTSYSRSSLSPGLVSSNYSSLGAIFVVLCVLPSTSSPPCPGSVGAPGSSSRQLLSTRRCPLPLPGCALSRRPLFLCRDSYPFMLVIMLLSFLSLCCCFTSLRGVQL